MTRKSSKKPDVSGIIIVLIILIGGVNSIPKWVKIALGTIAVITLGFWFFVRRTQRIATKTHAMQKSLRRSEQ